MAERRRLPVLDSGGARGASNGPGSSADDDEARPPWHWIGFGTVAIFATWLPLAYAAQAVVSRVLSRMFGASATSEEVAARIAALPEGERLRLTAILALPNAFAFALASFCGGLLVGRYAPRAGAREAALSGVVTSLFAIVLAWSGLTVTYVVTVLVVLFVAVLFSAWGGRVGAARRARAGGGQSGA